VRLFGNEQQIINFDNSKNITILLGNNGCGKSTILDTASVLLSPFVGSFPGNSTKNFKVSAI
jgi:predicted ATP-binding protein involved in virulence